MPKPLGVWRGDQGKEGGRRSRSGGGGKGGKKGGPGWDRKGVQNTRGDGGHDDGDGDERVEELQWLRLRCVQR